MLNNSFTFIIMKMNAPLLFSEIIIDIYHLDCMS